MSEQESNALAIIAALVAGDRWLNADACAVYLGLRPTKKGEANRRGKMLAKRRELMEAWATFLAER